MNHGRVGASPDAEERGARNLGEGARSKGPEPRAGLSGHCVPGAASAVATGEGTELERGQSPLRCFAGVLGVRPTPTAGPFFEGAPS